MNYSEVKALLDAGFTAEEIRGMLSGENNNPQFPQLSPQDENTNIPDDASDKGSEKGDPAQADQPEIRPDPVPGIEKNTNIPDFDKLNENISKLIKTIQLSNLQNNSYSSSEDADIDSKVDSIMAGIIRPEHTKGA